MKKLLIYIALALLLSSCATAKYKVRKHRNKIAQETIQYQRSLSAHEDWTRAFRNCHNRPKGRWPFNFLQ